MAFLFPRNRAVFEQLLSGYRIFLQETLSFGIQVHLYGSLAYAHYVGDWDIDINDLDFVTENSNFLRIINIFQNNPHVLHELTPLPSVRLFMGGAKLSIHDSAVVFPDRFSARSVSLHGMNFSVVDEGALLKAYAPRQNALQKEGYVQKFVALAHHQFQGQYAFFLLKPSLLKNRREGEVCQFIEKQGFTILRTDRVTLDPADVDFLYKQDYQDLTPVLTESGAEAALKNAHRLYDGQEVIFLTVTRTEGDAIEKANLLKGKNFWPAQCEAESLRYQFRSPAYDTFVIPAGKIVETPCDNVIHTARCESDFAAAYVRFVLGCRGD